MIVGSAIDDKLVSFLQLLDSSHPTYIYLVDTVGLRYILYEIILLFSFQYGVREQFGMIFWIDGEYILSGTCLSDKRIVKHQVVDLCSHVLDQYILATTIFVFLV